MILLGILAAAAAAPAVPSAARFEDVHVGSVVLHVPFPEGYCKPVGDDVATMQMLAAGDSRNVTVLSLVECSGGPNYLLVKAPVSALSANLDRAEAIKEMADALELPGMVEKMNGDMQEQVSASKTEVNGVETKVAGQILPRGYDDVCVYFGGLMTTSVSDNSQTQAVGNCTTVIGKRLIAFNAYLETTDPAGYKSLLRRMREWALRIEPMP